MIAAALHAVASLLAMILMWIFILTVCLPALMIGIFFEWACGSGPRDPDFPQWRGYEGK